MVQHTVEFEYRLPEWGSMQIDMDAYLDQAEKEEFALTEIKEAFEGIEDIEITSIKVT